ncbi:hypothetical protein C8F01DRAFT_1087323 [Mycena amicta]|nr:hypothetical protein C8F01DRAFT_1087323 [Mycena amicta]
MDVSTNLLREDLEEEQHTITNSTSKVEVQQRTIVLQDTGDSEDVLENSDQAREGSQQSEDVFSNRYTKYPTGTQDKSKVQVQVGGYWFHLLPDPGLYILLGAYDVTYDVILKAMSLLNNEVILLRNEVILLHNEVITPR